MAGKRRLASLALAAALVPFLLPALDLIRRWGGGWVPAADIAVIEHVTREVGVHPVLVGTYSRFGWHHPGPALYYLLAVPYRLLGSSSAALPLTALLLNAGSVALCAVLIRRRAGTAAMIWGLLVLGLYLRKLEPGFLTSDWNPFVPLLPFTVLVLACWSLLAGDRRLLPLVVGTGSFCVQCHLGYALGVAAVWLVTGVLAAAYWLRHGRPVRVPRAWRGPVVASVLVLALLWLPPVIDQLTGHPGNVTALVRYFRGHSPSWTYEQGFRQVSSSAGWLPGWVTGRRATPTFLTPGQLPVWTGVLGLAALLAASAVALVRRSRAQLSLLLLTWSIAGAAVIAVQRVVGLLFDYLVQWTWTVGVMLWLAVGVVLLEGAAGWARRWAGSHGSPAAGAPRRVSAVAVLPPLVAVTALSAVTALGWVTAVQTVAHPQSTAPELRPLAAAVLRWLGPHRHDVVTVTAARTVRPSLVGTTPGVSGMVLALERAGVDVAQPARDRVVFGDAATAHFTLVRWEVVVALARGGSPGPARGQRLLATAGDYAVYGAVYGDPRSTSRS